MLGQTVAQSPVKPSNHPSRRHIRGPEIAAKTPLSGTAREENSDWSTEVTL